MTATRNGPLGTQLTIIALVIVQQHHHQILPSAVPSRTAATSLRTTTADPPAAQPFFDMPSRIDEDDLLQEYGHFMLSNMNQSISPCEDFYEYACGSWKHADAVPARFRNIMLLHAMQKNINEMISAFLSNSTEDKSTLGTAESKAKMFYNSCVNMSRDLSHGYKLLLESDEFHGELKGNGNGVLDWITINFVSSYGVYPLLPLKLVYNPEGRKYDVLLTVPIKILGNPDIVDVKNLTSDFKIAGQARIEEFTTEMNQMIDFEKNLTRIVSKRNSTEILTMAEFLSAHKGDGLNWTRYFEVAFNGSAKSEWIVHNVWDDVSGLVRFLNKTDLATLRSYVKWRTLLKFDRIWKVETKDKSVESTCRRHTLEYFNHAIVPWFIDAVYDADQRADILQLAAPIKDTFYGLIGKQSWLDDDTKSNAKTKLQAMDIVVGYSDEMRHREPIDREFNEVVLTADWFRNLQLLEALSTRKDMQSVNKAQMTPLMSPWDVNAYYAKFLNLVFISIGITLFPNYHIKFPPSLKFGGIGCTIGHEMAHGFDSNSYQFNYDGKKENWWSEASLRNFRERYRCLESQYNKFIYHGVPTNGSLTSADNIADNVGARISYLAYLQRFGKADGHLKPIPDLNFTNKQLFFLKFAQSMCTGEDDVYKLKMMKIDQHADVKFRVMGTLSNIPEFSEVFQCKLGTTMNPLKKCVVW